MGLTTIRRNHVSPISAVHQGGLREIRTDTCLFSRSPRVQDQQCIVQGATATESPRAFPFQIERIDLPSADRMRNAEFHDRHLPGVIEMGNEEAAWLEKMGFESHGFLNLNRL